jgi:acyl-CoA reductase-like NAD-dependent aldehyde dehydrogenase
MMEIAGHCAGGTIDVIEPATGDILGPAGRANSLCACAPAKTWQPSWAKMADGDRATIFRRAAAVLKHNRAGVARLIGRETGSIVLKAC